MSNLLLYGLHLSAKTHCVTLTLSLLGVPFDGCVFTLICTSRLSSAATHR